MSTRACDMGGWLVGLDGWIPSNVHDRAWPGGPRSVGCSRLRCAACAADVRRVERGAWPADAAASWSLAAEPGALPQTAGAIHRLYLCRCGVFAAIAPESAVNLDPSGMTSAPSGWSCQGHAALPVPGDLDGLHVDGRDWPATLRTAMARADLYPPPFRAWPAFGAARLFAVLPDDERVAAEAGLRTVLESDTGRALAAALEAVDMLGGAEPIKAWLCGYAAEHPERFATGPLPWAPGLSLAGLVAEAVAPLLQAPAVGPDLRQAALGLLERAALAAPGLTEGLVTLHRAQPGWVAQHAVPLAQTQPWAWKLVLDLVRSEGRDVLVASADRLARQGLIPDDELQVRLRTPLRRDESELVWRAVLAARP